MTGTIDQVLHATPEPPSGDYHLVEVTVDRFDPAAIPDRYRNTTIGGQPRQRPDEHDLRRRFLMFTLPSFRVTYHDGTTMRAAYLVGDPPGRRVRDVDEERLSVRLLRLRQLLGGLLARLRAAPQRSGPPRPAVRIGLTAAVLALLGAGLVLLVYQLFAH
jgi:hypothetical protein